MRVLYWGKLVYIVHFFNTWADMTTEINKNEIMVKNCKNLSSRSPKLDLNRLSLISFVAFRPSDATFLFVCLKHKNCFAYL